MNKNQCNSHPMREITLALVTAPFLLFGAGVSKAQNECGLQLQPGEAEAITCGVGDYPNGITYSADGDLELLVPSGAGDLTLNAAGVEVGASGNDALGWDSSAFTGIVRGTDGALIDFSSVGGDISILTNRITGSGPASHGIRAVSDSGSLHIQHNGAINTVATGIEATTVSGDITLVSNGGINATGTTGAAIRATSADGNIDLALRGSINDPVLADTSAGTGGITADVFGSLVNTRLSLTTGTGALNVTVHQGAQIRGLLEVAGAGTGEITLRPGALLPRTSTAAGALHMAPDAGGAFTLNVENRMDYGQFRAADAGVAITGGGAGRITVNNRAFLNGGMNFSANTGGVTIHNWAVGPATPDAEAWMIGGAQAFQGGSADDLIVNHAGALLISSGTTNFTAVLGNIQSELVTNHADLGTGDDALRNEGVIILGEARFRLQDGALNATLEASPRGTETILSGLETFENSGTILFGGWTRAEPRQALFNNELVCFRAQVGGVLQEGGISCSDYYGITDEEPSDVLYLPGTHFAGGVGSTLLMDVMFGLGVAQTDCTSRAGPEGRWRLAGADCLDIREGSTSGQTMIVLHDRLPGDLGAYNPEGLVVVNVKGGVSAAGHFVLSPDSDGYDTALGAIDKGLFVFPLMYDEPNQQHKLVGLPGARALQMPLLVQGALGLSRRAGEVWFQRNQDLRQSVAGDAGGAWARVTTTRGSRDVQQDISAYGQTLSTRNDFDQDDTLITLGRDLIAGDSGWMVGGSIGYARSQLSFASTGADADFDGITLGLHARYQQGPFHLDNQLLGSWLQVDYEDRAFSNADDPYDALETETQGLGARLEAGWRFDLGETLYLQPLASASWERTEFDRLTIRVSGDSARPTNEIFGDHTPTSLRTALGARVGLDQALGTLRLSMMLTGRLWNELRGETPVRIRSAGPDLVVDDTFDSALSEIALGVGLGNAGGTVSGHLQVDGTFGDDYDSFGMTAGFRYQW